MRRRVAAITSTTAAGTKRRANACDIHTTGAVQSNCLEGRGLPLVILLATFFALFVGVKGAVGVLTVPVLLGVIETLADSHRMIATVPDFAQHMLSEVVDGLLMDVVSDDQPGFVGDLPWIHSLVEDVLGDLDGVGTVVGVVTSVEVVQDNMVSKLTQVIKTARLGKAARVRRTHVSREAAQNVTKSHLILQELVFALVVRDLAKILVRPGVAGNLMAFELHAFDQCAPGHVEVIDRTLATVVARNEEGRLGVVPLQQTEKFFGVFSRAIVERQSNGTRDGT